MLIKTSVVVSETHTENVAAVVGRGNCGEYFPAVFLSLKEELSGQRRLSLVPTSLPPQCEAELFGI